MKKAINPFLSVRISNTHNDNQEKKYAKFNVIQSAILSVQTRICTLNCSRNAAASKQGLPMISKYRVGASTPASQWMRYLVANHSSKHRLRKAVLRTRAGAEFGSVYFWASWIRIRNLFVRIRIRILPSSKQKMKKNLDFYCFVTSYWLLIFEELKIFFVGVLNFIGYCRKEQDPELDP